MEFGEYGDRLDDLLYHVKFSREPLLGRRVWLRSDAMKIAHHAFHENQGDAALRYFKFTVAGLHRQQLMFKNCQ